MGDYFRKLAAIFSTVLLNFDLTFLNRLAAISFKTISSDAHQFWSENCHHFFKGVNITSTVYLIKFHFMGVITMS